MKNMKKAVLALIFICVILVGACSRSTISNNKNTKSNVQITVWHYYNGSQLEAFDKMVREFNSTVGAEKGITVDASSQGGVNDLAEHIWDIVEGVAGSGGLPDIFGAYPDTVYELQEMGYTVDLTDYMSEDEIFEYVTGFWAEGCLPPDNTATIFPMAKATEILYLDAAAWNDFLQLLAEDGQSGRITDENLKTWQGIAEAADLYYQYTGQAMFGIDSPSNYIFTLMEQQGMELAECLQADGVLYWNEKAFRTAFDIYYSSVLKGSFGMSGRYRSDDAKTGEIISYLGSSTGASYFPDKITYENGSQKQAELLALTVPVIENGQKVVVQQGAGMVVTKSEARREAAAIEFLKWLTEKEQNLLFSLDSSYLPVKMETLFGPEMEALLIDMEKSDDTITRNTGNVFAAALEQIQDYRTYYTIPFAGVYELRQELEGLDDYARTGRQQVVDLIADGATWEEATDQIITEQAYLTFKKRLEANTIIIFE